jgi:hypothetical protein
MTLTVVCAWCLHERGEAPQAGQSHGICEPHRRQLLADFFDAKHYHWCRSCGRQSPACSNPGCTEPEECPECRRR